MTTETAGCPFHARSLPTDSTPLTPSPEFAEWRAEGAATPLSMVDGHDGLIVTRHELAREVLVDPRFSQQPQRFPLGPAHQPPADVDQRAQDASDAANLLSLDGDKHLRIRRSITSRFTVKAARGKTDVVAAIVERQLAHLKAQGSPVDLTTEYAQPISAAMHCNALGIPDSLAPRFTELFVGSSTGQQKNDFLREVIEAKRDDLGEDVISDLLRSELTPAEIEGIVLVLMTSGRDSVAYMIATSTVALLTHPEQLAALRADPTLISGAIEEFMRYGAMFLTLFPRTATEDVELDGVLIRKGQTVAVSPVGANRDERRFENPEEFDIQRDAFGHLGFGSGMHGCVGQQLARIEIREAILQLVQGIPSLRLIEAEQLGPMPYAHDVATYEAGSVIIGWD